MHRNIEAIDQALSVARSKSVRGFLSYMQKIHPTDRLPARSAFEPMELRQYLNDVVLVEVHRTDPGAGLRFFVRLAGDRILDASPVPLMNRYLDEAFADGAGQIMIDVRRDVVSTGKTYYWYGPPRMKFKLDFVETVEYAHCPLAEDGVTVDRIVSVFSYGGAK